MKLPPLPRMRKKAKAREAGTDLIARFPLDRAGREPGDNIPQHGPNRASILVTPLRPTDATGVGHWFETNGEGGSQWGGRCCRCRSAVRAVDLRWAIGAFGRWEGWTCRDCRAPVKGQGLEGTKPATMKRDRPTRLWGAGTPIPQSQKERIYWFNKRLEPQIQEWENEGGAVNRQTGGTK